MELVQAWRCPYTKKLFEFEDKEAYIKHVRSAAAKKAHADKAAKMKADRLAALQHMRETCTTMDEIEEFVRANFQLFVDNAVELRNFGWIRGAKTKRPKITLKSFSISGKWYADLNYMGYCPPEKKQKPNRPGWYGRIAYSLVGDYWDGFGSEFFENTGFHTGTGGGSSNKYGYDLTLHSSDWIAMEKKRADDALIKRLTKD